MTARLPIDGTPALSDYRLTDNLTATRGRIFLTGTQALVRLLLMQRAADAAQGLNTAGFVSGYRGSPLGMVDQQLWKAKKLLDGSGVRFLPAINEELGGTAVLGTQRVEADPERTVEGVYAMWYGKGPGVDRAGDALKHGNAYGSSPHGGVLVVAGDDHGCVSSSMPHQSDFAMIAWHMPVVNPSNIADMLEFGLYGWALSRYSGAWVGFKAISETVESGSTVDLDAVRTHWPAPAGFTPPAGGLHNRWPDLPSLTIEARLAAKLDAVRHFARTHSIDKWIAPAAHANVGIVTCGKAHLDLMEALRRLDLTVADLEAAGVRIYKVGLSYPLEMTRFETFVDGLAEVLVIEEKGPVIEQQIKDYLYNRADGARPRVLGKHDAEGACLLSELGELRPSRILPVFATWLARHKPALDRRERVVDLVAPQILSNEADAVKRTPYFCSGCPHNTSTKVPEGSIAQAGIGCHFMASWMERDTTGLIQMGGEGVDWAAHAMFTNTKHVFQNLGDGTYFHSGILAIRQAVAAKANITYKILYNDAVAMTGGQPVDGSISVPQIARQVEAEGVSRFVVVSDEPEKYDGHHGLFPKGTTFHHRSELDAVQRELRETPGVTVLIYDQTCAAEKRRRRKKGEFPDPDKRLFINDAVCEGCGDCGVQSNCLSVEPLETPLGRKRRIDQSSCNKDFSCVNGFCPSFVTVEGAALKKAAGAAFDEAALAARVDALPVPATHLDAAPFDMLVTGVGGTGVVTIGALLGMAAHLENKGVTVLDVTGLAQKGGAVMSHVQISHAPTDIHATRIAMGEADLVIGCDALVTAGDECTSRMRHDATRVVVNSAQTPTADFIKNPNWSFPGLSAEQDIRAAAGDAVDLVDANRFAVALLGDAIYTNPFVLGYAWQKGWLPLTLASLERAIELNAVQVDKNRAAFDWGRRAAHDLASVQQAAAGDARNAQAGATVITLHTKKSVDTLIAKRVDFLTAYQNAAYAARYAAFVDKVRAAERALADGDAAQEPLTEAVARSLFKLMAYKDEYEVARLQSDPAFLARLSAQFEGDWKLKFHLAPPLFAKKDAHGHLVKKAYGPWMMSAFRMLAKLKCLRGTGLDPFGRTDERRTERALIGEYEALVDELVGKLNAANRPLALELAALPDGIRGYGHVKENNLRAVRQKWNTLLAQWRSQAGSQNHQQVA